jgi:uncharacterized membrane protein
VDLSIAVFFSYRMTRAFNGCPPSVAGFPLAVSTATVLALMVSMYTVWAGALYTVVWVIMLGLANTLIDTVLASTAQWEVGGTRRGFEVLRPISGSSAFRPQPSLRITRG